MTANIILTTVAALSLFLAIIALKAAKNAHDKYESLHYDLKARGDYTATKFQNLRGELDTVFKELRAVDAGVSNVREVLDAGFELRANVQQDVHKLHRMIYTLAENLPKPLYWEVNDGRWSDAPHPYGGNGLVGAAGCASNQLGAQVKAQRGANRTKRRA